MGAVIGAAYALSPDWYRGVRRFAEEGFPESAGHSTGARGRTSRLSQIVSGAMAVWDLGRGWGADSHDVRLGREALQRLLGPTDLRDGRVPLAVTATDLLSGERVVLREGPAVDSVYASSALAGVLPPERIGRRLLADGAYTDVCPIDVARGFGCDKVIAVNPGRSEVVGDISNGLQGLIRATEICYLHHAILRFDKADFVIEPAFRRAVDTLEFSAYRECIAAGSRAIRANALAIGRALEA